MPGLRPKFGEGERLQAEPWRVDGEGGKVVRRKIAGGGRSEAASRAKVELKSLSIVFLHYIINITL